MDIITETDLYRHLEEVGYKIISLEEIFTNGATRCRYFSLLLEDGERRFIKTGEKVDYEIININYLSEINFTQTPRIFIGSDLKKKILITSLAAIPRLGYDLVYIWYSYPMQVVDIQRISIPILKRRAVKRAGVFGSSARGEVTAHDIDMLVEMSRPHGLFSLLSLKNELEDAFGTKVDLIEYASIKPGLRKHILHDEVAIL